MSKPTKKTFCIPANVLKVINEKIADQSIISDVVKLSKMTYAEKVEHFAKNLDKELYEQLKEIETKKTDNPFQDKIDFLDKRRKYTYTISEYMADEFEIANAKQTRDALKKWKKEFLPTTKKKIKQSFFGKILDIKEEAKPSVFELDTIDELTDDFINNPDNLKDFFYGEVAELFNINPLQKEEIKKILELAEKIQSEYNKSQPEYQNKLTEKEKQMPENKIILGGYTEGYWKALDEMDVYQYKLNPSPIVEQMLYTLSRLPLLASFKSPATNIIANIPEGLNQITTRFLTNFLTTRKMKIYGDNYDLVWNYIKDAFKIFINTGHDISRSRQGFESDKIFYGEAQRADLYIRQFDTDSTKKTTGINKFLEYYQKAVFKYGQGLADNIFASIQFALELGVNSTLTAEKEIYSTSEHKGKSKSELKQLVKERAREIFLDASNLEVSELNSFQRDAAILSAQRGTYTDETFIGKVPTHIRNFFNLILKPFGIERGLGEAFIPFGKIPANAAGRVLLYGGYTYFKTIGKLFQVAASWKGKKTDPVLRKKQIADLVRSFSESLQAGILLALVYMFVEPEDYIGEFATNERELQYLREGRRNSIKLFGHWVSLDYFGFLAAPLVGVLSAKKYGNNLKEGLVFYSKSFGQQFFRVPGIQQLTRLLTSSQKFAEDTKIMDIDDKFLAYQKVAVDFVVTRTLPIIMNDIYLAFNPVPRTDYTDRTQKLKQYLYPIDFTGSINKLEPKINLFGKKTEMGVPYLFFGSRLSFDNRNEIWDELNVLNESNQLPNLKQLDRVDRQMKELRQQVGEKQFTEILEFYGEWWTKLVGGLINSAKYKNEKDAEKKKKMINEEASKIKDYIKKKYGVKK